MQGVSDVSRGKHAVERKRVGGAQTLTEKAMVDMVTSIGIHTMAHHGMKRWWRASLSSSCAYSSSMSGTSTE